MKTMKSAKRETKPTKDVVNEIIMDAFERMLADGNHRLVRCCGKDERTGRPCHEIREMSQCLTCEQFMCKAHVCDCPIPGEAAA